MKIIIEVNNEHQSYKLSQDGYPVVLTDPPGSSVVGNGNGFFVVKENVSEEVACLTIKDWFDKGFVECSPKSNDFPNAAVKVFIPIRRIVEIHVLD